MTTFHNSALEQEAREKWGQTPAFQEYDQKHSSRQALTQGLDRIMAEFALCMQKGEKPESTEAQSLVKKLQDYITRNCYHCTDQILAGLGQMYVADERFKNNIDTHADGAAVFISRAIEEYTK